MKFQKEYSEETMTKPDEAKAFVEASNIDALAPSVGNLHGMVKTGNPKLNSERIREIVEATGIPQVLHGGSGISDEDFREAIKSGVTAVHISTELRIAFRKGIEEAFSDNPDQLAPYRYFVKAKAAVKAKAKERMQLFWGEK